MGQEGCKGPSPSSAVTAWDLGVTPHSHCATSEGLTWNSRSKRKKGASLPSSWDATGGSALSLKSVSHTVARPAAPCPGLLGRPTRLRPPLRCRSSPAFQANCAPPAPCSLPGIWEVYKGDKHTLPPFSGHMTQAEKYNSAFWRK